MASGVGLEGALWSIDVAMVGTEGLLGKSRWRSDQRDDGFHDAGNGET